jgi:hypothetical protein
MRRGSHDARTSQSDDPTGKAFRLDSSKAIVVVIQSLALGLDMGMSTILRKDVECSGLVTIGFSPSGIVIRLCTCFSTKAVSELDGTRIVSKNTDLF